MLQDEIERYLLSLITIRSRQTITWYRKRLAPLKQLTQNAALAAGADISDVAHLLGHSQVQTTYQFYGRWDAAELHELHDRYTWLRAEVEQACEP